VLRNQADDTAGHPHAEVADELGALVAAAQRALAGADDGAGDGEPLVFNAAPHARDGVPALGAAPRARLPEAAKPLALKDGFVLDNGLLRVAVDAHGLITSAYDLAAGREALPPGAVANLLQLRPATGAFGGAVRDLVEADTVRAVDGGVRVVRSAGASRIEQTLSLRAGSRRLEVDATVEWRERERLLTASFPLDVRAAHFTAGVPFGHVERPARADPAPYAARSDVRAHGFLHVGEPGWGAALLGDAPCEHRVTRDVRSDGGTTTTVRMALLGARPGSGPGPGGPGERLRYALLLGAGVPEAVREGGWFGLPGRVREGGGAAVAPLVAVDDAGVVVSAVKLADDRSGDLVVRLHEAHGRRARATLTTGFPLGGVTVADLLERPAADGGAAGAADGGGVRLALRPFQVLTLRLGVSGGRAGAAGSRPRRGRRRG
jgi:alpha-mannosidase